VPHASIVGKDPIEIFGKWPELYNRFLTTEKTREEVLIPGDPSLTLEVVITPLYDDKSKELSGRIILAYDVTKHKLMETELKARITEIDFLRMQLQEQAIRDPLTGAFNRRYFSEALDQEAARSARENTPFSILILDVDHFKQFNDTYGHKCGDIVLQSLANFLNENTRQGDIVCRYGGEEFVILMTDATPEDAYKRAELFRKRFEEMILEYEGKKLNCTFSAGIASYPAHDRASETLLTFADQALYRSKASGRNRTTLYSLQDQYQILES
jgi:diguanylate cyclase (GGDEF)-like protein